MTGYSKCESCDKEFKWRKCNNGRAARFCSRKCLGKKVKTWSHKNRFLWKKSTKKEQLEHLTKIFNKHAIKNENCWGWNGVLHKTGYALMNYNAKYKNTGAHRVSWYIYNGKMPKKLVLHSCDNKSCTNPSHLFLGTHKQNTMDMLKKGRGNPSKGINHIYAKLTIEQVKEIKKLLKMGVTVRRICDDFKMSSGAISAIKNGITWKHVD